MAGKDDRVDKFKSLTKNFLDGLLDNLLDKEVINKRNLQQLGSGISNIIKGTENLFEEFSKNKEGNKVLMVIGNPKTQLCLKLVPENEEGDSKDKTPATVSDSKDKAEGSKEHEKLGSAQTLNCSQSATLQTKNLLKLCPSAYCHETKTKREHEIYPMKEKKGRTRLALIIHNKEFEYLNNRDGSEYDLWGMEALLKDLGYSVIVAENLTALEMKKELKRFAGRQEHLTSDSTILVFMSHGIQKGICGVKHKEEEPDILPDDTIFQALNNRNCRNLKDKPKVIITQACRGRGKGLVWVADQAEDSARKATESSLLTDGMTTPAQSDAVTPSHVERDFIAFRSSTLNNISWRLDTGGSLFISELIRCLKTYSWCCHLEEIFRKVQHSFENPTELAQMPTIDRVTLTRYLYLFPGN